MGEENKSKNESRKLSNSENKKETTKERKTKKKSPEKKKKIIIIAIIAVIVIVIAVVAYIIYKNVNGEVEYEKGTPEYEAQFYIEREADSQEEPETYESEVTYTESADEDGLNIESTDLEENAILVTDGATVNLTNATIIRNSEDSEDEKGAKQFGIGAAVLAKNGIINLADSVIETTGKGVAGLYSYTDGVIMAQNVTITTTGDNAGGIHASTGGTITAIDCTVTTSGQNSSAVRSEADGGLMEIEGGTYTTNGEDSAAIYGIATIVASNATFVSNYAEAVNIDGAHSVTLVNCDVTANMPSIYEKHQFGDNAITWAVGIAQSTVKDETQMAEFYMTDGTLTSKNGGLIHVTNATARITLENVTINPSESNDFFLQCTANNNVTSERAIWGNLGSNGGTCDITIINQEIDGDVIWDSISRVDFEITEGSTYKGAVIDDETAVVDTEDAQTTGSCNITIDESSTWIVTGNSTVSSLENAGSIVDEEGNAVTIQSINGKVYVEGNSSYVITVDIYSE